jgi:DHA2 family multidrug resistance protein
VFYVNVPFGIIAALGIAIFIRDNRRAHQEAFDFFGFATLSVAIGSFQMMLDRGAVNDWFASPEIWIEATIAALSLYLLIVHTVTTDGRSFLSRELLKNAPFVAGTILIFFIGITMNGTLALLPLMLEQLMGYPVLTTGLVTAPRGIGTMIGMFVVARIINHVDVRLILTVGLCLLAVSCWQMTAFSLQMGPEPVIISGLIQGFGFGFTGVPLNLIALSNLPRHILTQGTAIRGLMRNLGGSTGIPILVAQLTTNTQIVHARLAEHLRPDNPMIPTLASHFSLTDPAGVAALNREITRQATMVAYVDDFKLMMLVSLASIPLVLLLRRPQPRPPPRAAPAE